MSLLPEFHCASCGDVCEPCWCGSTECKVFCSGRCQGEWYAVDVVTVSPSTDVLFTTATFNCPGCGPLQIAVTPGLAVYPDAALLQAKKLCWEHLEKAHP